MYETTTITSITCLLGYMYLRDYTAIIKIALLLSWCFYFGMGELFNTNRTTFKGYKHPGIFIGYGIIWIATLSFIIGITHIKNILLFYDINSSHDLDIEGGFVLIFVTSTILLRDNLAFLLHTILSHDSNLCKLIWVGVTPHYLCQSRKKKENSKYRFRWSLIFYETILHIGFGTIVSNYITSGWLSLDNVSNIHKLCITGIVILTTVFGYHQSFNAMVLTIVNNNVPWYYNVPLILGVQITSSIGQAVVGYKTNVIHRVMTSPADKEMTDNILRDFGDKMTLRTSVKMGYVLNSLGDTVYSIIWGNFMKLKNYTWCTLLWSSVFKESVMMVTTVLYTLTESSGLSDSKVMININYIIKIITTIYMVTNHIISMVLLRRYMTYDDTAVTKTIFHPSLCRRMSIQILRIIIVCSIITSLILYYVFSSDNEIIVYLINSINILIMFLFFLRIT
jgi:hypothetical protein